MVLVRLLTLDKHSLRSAFVMHVVNIIEMRALEYVRWVIALGVVAGMTALDHWIKKLIVGNLPCYAMGTEDPLFTSNEKPNLTISLGMRSVPFHAFSILYQPGKDSIFPRPFLVLQLASVAVIFGYFWYLYFSL